MHSLPTLPVRWQSKVVRASRLSLVTTRTARVSTPTFRSRTRPGIPTKPIFVVDPSVGWPSKTVLGLDTRYAIQRVTNQRLVSSHRRLCAPPWFGYAVRFRNRVSEVVHRCVRSPHLRLIGDIKKPGAIRAFLCLHNLFANLAINTIYHHTAKRSKIQ